MKAVGFRKPLPIEDANALIDLEIPVPQPHGRDLLVKIAAIAVNPVDYKVRGSAKVDGPDARILGWDAAGTVTGIGPDAKLFKPGDAVFYAGSITRPGANSEYHLVDERIVGRKPASLDFAAAAAIPLTAITAWEALFDRLAIDREGGHKDRSILIIGGAGGVGSIAIQLAAKVAQLKVIATASRPESAAWCRMQGAHNVIDHFRDMPAQLKTLGFNGVDYILCLNDTDRHFSAMAEAIAPQGRICSIVETKGPLDIGALMRKSAGFVWELMFTRAIFETPDMIAQHNLLNRVAELIDAGTLRGTANETMSPINAENLRAAHRKLEGGRTVGKIVLTGFG
jgi:zinc-binding alcohol dehydrogenase family protein